MTHFIVIFCLIFAICTLTLILTYCIWIYRKEKYKKHTTYYISFTFPESRHFRSLSPYTTPILQKYHIKHIYAKYKISYDNPGKPMATLTIKLPDKSETPISIDVFQKVCMELTKSIQQFLTTNHPPKLWMTTVCNKQTETHTIEMPEIKN